MKLKKLSLSIFLVMSGIVTLNLVLPAHAADGDICNNPNVSDKIKSASGCNENGGELANVIIGIINAVLAVVGIVAVVAIIIGGIQYMTSTGDPGKVKKAKDTILYAVIGLIIDILAAAIVNFVIAGLTK